MSEYHFSNSSLSKLQTCDKKLQELFQEVIKHRDCTIICGHRDERAQTIAYETGKSKARFGQSRHNSYPSEAVDVMPYPIDWSDIPRVKEFANFVLGVAAAKGIDIKWGGEFKSFFDGPHYELRRD